MSFTLMSDDLDIIVKLGDEPNSAPDDLTAPQLKATFDEAGNLLKVYLNGTLIVEMSSVADGDSGGDNIGMTAIAGVSGATAQAIAEGLKDLIDDLESDKIDATDVYTKVELDGGQLDDRYYTETEIDALESARDSRNTADENALTTHKASADHDSRYYTEAELDAGQLDNRYRTESELSSQVTTAGTELIGGKAFDGISAGTLHAQLVEIKNALDDVVLGQIPNNSLEFVKFSEELQEITTQPRQTGGGYLINGTFSVWQRGTSFISPANNSYTADRAKHVRVVDSNIRIDQASPVNSNYKYSMRIEQTIGVGAVGARTEIREQVEDYEKFIGETVTLSHGVKIDSGVDVQIAVYDGVTTQTGSIVSGDGTFKEFYETFDISPSSTEILVILRFFREGISIGDGINFQYKRLELGSVATKLIPKLFAEVFNACQRYYQTLSAHTPIVTSAVTDTYGFMHEFITPMRATPTIGSVQDIGIRVGSTSYGVTTTQTVAITWANEYGGRFSRTDTGWSLGVGAGVIITSGINTFFDAEL